jgi:hypothetical protein
MVACFLSGQVIGQSGSDTFTISSGIYPGSSSYTVYVEDGVYYAKNAYGAVSYSNADASYVLQSALDNGLSVELKAGSSVDAYGYSNFILTEKLTIDNDYTTLKSDRNVRLCDSTGADTATLTISADFVTLENVFLMRTVGSEGAGGLIDLNGGQNGVFQSVRLANCNGTALYLHDGCYFNQFSKLEISNCLNGILIASTYDAPFLTNINSFYSTDIKVGRPGVLAGDYGVKIMYSNLNSFYNLDIESVYGTLTNGIHVWGCRGTSLNEIYVGEGFSSIAVFISGDSDFYTESTLVKKASFGGTITGVYVDYANETDIQSVRGVSPSGNLIELSNHHIGVRMSGLNLNEGENYLLDYLPSETLWLDPLKGSAFMPFSFTVTAGQTDKVFAMIGATQVLNDIYITKLAVTLVTAPSGSESVTVEIFDGVNTMSAIISGSATTNATVTDTFEWDVSANPLVFRYTSSGSCAVGVATVTINYYRTLT